MRRRWRPRCSLPIHESGRLCQPTWMARKRAQGEVRMTTNDLILNFESERSTIQEKLGKLKERDAFLEAAIAEIRKVAPSAAGGRSKAGRKGRKARKTGKGGKSGGGRGRKPKGAMTTADAIRKVIADAGHPLTPGEIVPAAAKLAGAAEISVRTRITPLAQTGALVKVDHEGRGFRYGLPPEKK